MINRFQTNAWVPVGFVRRWNGSAWVASSFVRRWDGQAWIQVWPLTSDFTVFSDTPEVTGGFVCTAIGGGSNDCPFISSITSSPVVVSTSGGSGAGPTYLWERVSGNTGITVSNSTASTVTFTGAVGRRQTAEAVWKCTVTRGAESKSVGVGVLLAYNYNSNNEVEP